MLGLRVVVVGDAAVGKTALISRMKRQPFVEAYEETLAVAFGYLVNKDLIPLNIVDTGGQEREQQAIFRRTVDIYFVSADIALICFDVSQPIDLNKMQNHLDRLRSYSTDVKFILVGTKEDLATDEQKEFFSNISLEGAVFERRILTSAKNNTGVEELKTAMFDIARLSSQHKPMSSLIPPADVDDVDADDSFSACLFLQMVAQHSATGVIGGVLMLAGLIALGIGIACLCPALVPVMAGIGIALSESAATSLAVAGGCGALFGTMATFFYKKANDTTVAGVSYEDFPPNDDTPNHPPTDIDGLPEWDESRSSFPDGV